MIRHVTTLHRFTQPNGTHWYLDPDSYTIGPFASPEEREADLAAHFVEHYDSSGAEIGRLRDLVEFYQHEQTLRIYEENRVHNAAVYARRNHREQQP